MCKLAGFGRGGRTCLRLRVPFRVTHLPPSEVMRSPCAEAVRASCFSPQHILQYLRLGAGRVSPAPPTPHPDTPTHLVLPLEAPP